MPKNKSLSQQRTPAKRISAEELFKPKPGSSSSPFSIRFPSQEPTAERIKLKPRQRKTKNSKQTITKEALYLRWNEHHEVPILER